MDVRDIDIENSKRLIINEIRRTAEKNGGVPLGMITFYKATGITIADWRGKLWLRWSDAVKEAGYPPNKKAGPYDEQFLIDKFIGLMRELGHFPLSTELEKKGYHNRTFPSHVAFRSRWGSKVQQAARITLYCQHHKGLADILAMCEPVLKSQDASEHGPVQVEGCGRLRMPRESPQKMGHLLQAVSKHQPEICEPLHRIAGWTTVSEKRRGALHPHG
jgi:hypothetical protein